MSYLISTVEVYREDSEKSAAALVEAAKKAPQYTLTKYTIEKKEKKVKGEVVEEYYKITLTKAFNDIKEPEDEVTVNYTVGAF